MKNSIYKNMILGTAYYPEHWDKTMWEADLLRMKEHGINMVRIGDFAWSKFEYKEGEYTIDYFDAFLSLCEKYNMDVIFCTPTAAPPVWVTHQYPEVLNHNKDGDALNGPRRHYNYNSPIYRKLCAKLVDKLAAHYCKWDIIVGWQIDNELNCDQSEFYSDSDHIAYRKYLKEKFENLDTLNESLGLTFWSRTYSDWEQVTLNKKCVGGAVNPHLALEEKRFFSESAIAFCKIQVDIIKKYLPKGKFITTNGLFDNLDYNKLMECGLDFITYDSYPNFAFDETKDNQKSDSLKDRMWSWNLTWTRSVSPIFGIMEQQAGANGWSTRMETPMPKPGQMKLWTMQSVAHGADMVAFFRWRTSPIGCEIYWHGLNDYSNIDNRRLRELKEISSIFSKLECIRGTKYKANVAVMKDYSNIWDASLDCWHNRVDYFSDNSWFKACQLTHTPCDFLFVRPTSTVDELLQYEMIVYAHSAIIDDRTSDLLKEYVMLGGTLVLGARTGYKDKFGRCPMRPMPGLVSDWCGVTVEDYTLVNKEDKSVEINWNGKCFDAPVFNEVLNPTDNQTKIIARFKGSYYDKQPALCCKIVGKGSVYYLGACFSEEMVIMILDQESLKDPYRDVIELPKEIELAVRTDGEIEYLFALNYSDNKKEIKTPNEILEIVSNKVYKNTIVLDPYDVKIFKYVKNKYCNE